MNKISTKVIFRPIHLDKGAVRKDTPDFIFPFLLYRFTEFSFQLGALK